MASATKTYFWVDPAKQLTGVLMAQYMLGTATPERDLRTIVDDTISG